MYNEETKNRFLETLNLSKTTKTRYKRVLEEFEPYEKEWNADLCTRPLKDITPVLGKVLGIRTSSKYSATAVILKYVKWCRKTGAFPDVNAELEKINSSEYDYEVFRYKMIPNPLVLQRYLNLVYAPESDRTFDNIFRCYLWFAFMGIGEKQSIKIKCSEVDFRTLTIYHDGVEYPIIREAIPSLKNCVELDEFVYAHPLYTKLTFKSRTTEDIVLRGYNERSSAHILRLQTSNDSAINQEKTGVLLNYTRVWLSGIFYNLYVQEQTTGFADFEKATMQYLREKSRSEPLDPTKINHIRKIDAINDITNDYKRWKSAFGL